MLARLIDTAIDRVEKVDVIDLTRLLQVQSSKDGTDIIHFQLCVLHVRIQKDEYLLLVEAVTLLSVDEAECLEHMRAILARRFDSFKLSEQSKFVVEDLPQAEVNLSVELNDDLSFTIDMDKILVQLL